QKVYQQIETRPVSAVATKEEIAETVQRIENEVKEKGEQANESRLQLWMDFLGQMAPDIVDVILASLGGPVSAATAVLKKVAERARKPAAAA
ncbi:MAG: caspase family protein, partial [Chloroflexota bacterium]